LEEQIAFQRRVGRLLATAPDRKPERPTGSMWYPNVGF